MRFESEPRLYSIQHCRYAKVKLKCRIFLTSQENLIPKLGVYIHCVYDFFFFFSSLKRMIFFLLCTKHAKLLQFGREEDKMIICLAEEIQSTFCKLYEWIDKGCQVFL